MYSFTTLLADSLRVTAIVAIIALAAIVTHQLNPITNNLEDLPREGTVAGAIAINASDISRDYSISTAEFRVLGADDYIYQQGNLTSLIKSYQKPSIVADLVEIYNPTTQPIRLALSAKVPTHVSEFVLVDLVANNELQPLVVPGVNNFPIHVIEIAPFTAKTLQIKVVETETINFAYSVSYQFAQRY